MWQKRNFGYWVKFRGNITVTMNKTQFDRKKRLDFIVIIDKLLAISEINPITENWWSKKRGAYPRMTATMKVKAGTRSTMAEARVGELYCIPT